MDTLPTADKTLKKHLIAKIEQGKTSNEDRAEAINLAMIDHSKLAVKFALENQRGKSDITDFDYSQII